MNNPNPSCPMTKVDDGGHTWLPCSFPDFLQELAHLATLCTGVSPLPLYRGHADRGWLLESTLARYCKKFILGLDPSDRIEKRVQESVEYHRIVLNILLLKYGVIMRPPNENAAGLDTWDELMRNLQQYPKLDKLHIQGTFYLDWTRSPDVAIFFTNLDRRGDGALWVCDAAATGETRPLKQLGEVLDTMNQRCNKLNPDPPGCPLFFDPEPQTQNQRALRQQAEYFAQMDLRYDLASAWSSQETNRNRGDQIYVKLILPNGTQQECSSYLIRKSMTQAWLFPGEDDLHPTSRAEGTR